MSDHEAEARIERVLPGPIEKVWEHLTDPRRVRGWLGNDITSDDDDVPSSVGAAVTLRLEDGEVVKGTVERREPPHVIAYRWAEGSLSFELVPRGEDVVLVLTRTKRVTSHSFDSSTVIRSAA